VELADRVAPAGRAIRDAAEALVEHRSAVLAGLVGLQLLLTAALALSVEHNAWLWYQGGDQIWLTSSGWLLAHLEMPWTIIGFAWPVALLPIMAIAGPGMVDAMPLTLVLNVLVLGPLATASVYVLGSRIAGRAIGLWCAALWVVAPYVAIPLFVERYHERYVEQFLPQALGLTQMADYPSMVLVLVSAALVLRSIDARSVPDAVLAGLVAGFAAGAKPANYLFLVGPALGYALARRWPECWSFALGLVPATLALAIWKWKGLGGLPLLTAGEVRAAAGTVAPPVASVFDRVDTLDWDAWKLNMSGLREYFWSGRLLQWAPLAGALVVVRRSPPAAGLLLGWMLSYVVIKGSSPVATVDSGSFFRILMPAFPAFLVLVAMVPLLVPTSMRRLGSWLDPPPVRPARRRSVALTAVVLGAIPIALVSVATTVSDPNRVVIVNEILVPVDADAVGLRVERSGSTQRLTWRTPTDRARVFYHVYRTPAGVATDTFCFETGATQCKLNSTALTRTRNTSYVDNAPLAGATYRIGVAANWEDDPEQGDVFLLSAPVRVAR
jgi:hypothetical protein